MACSVRYSGTFSIPATSGKMPVADETSGMALPERFSFGMKKSDALKVLLGLQSSA
jgi:hypothetical protein